jgi:1-acyl-sn-glycerol-3-phosphate acyltransferase
MAGLPTLPGPLGDILRPLTGLARSVAGLAASPGAGDLDDRDPDYIRDWLPLGWLLASLYFRSEVRGLELLPDDEPVLLVGNHSGGTVIPDTFVFGLAYNAYFGVEKPFHPIAHDRLFTIPVLGPIMRKLGALPASPTNAALALESGASVLVYPGGDHEVYRPSWHSARIDFDDRKGFVRLALEHGVKIAPVVSIGGQETALFLSQGVGLSKLLHIDELLRIKVLPIALCPPWGVNVGVLPYLPLPAKLTIQVLEPIDVTGRFGDDPDVDEVYDGIVARMQSCLDGLADERSLPLVG